MTASEINVAIAEACGWTRFGKSSGPISSGKALLGSWKTGDYGTPPEDREKPEYDQSFEPIPNYYGDLNAIHAVFEIEAPAPFDDFNFKCELAWQLQLIVEKDYDENPRWCGPFPQLKDQLWAGKNFWICNATAAQRAEAFLKTIGKHPENKKESNE